MKVLRILAALPLWLASILLMAVALLAINTVGRLGEAFWDAGNHIAGEEEA